MSEPQVWISTEATIQSSGSTPRTRYRSIAYNNWKPYIRVFGKVTLIARQREDSEAAGHVVTGDGVSVYTLPGYKGLKGLLSAFPQLIREFNRIGTKNDLFVGRIFEPLSILLYIRSRKVKGRFIAVLVNDPESLQYIASSRTLNQFIQKASKVATRHILMRSRGVIYVSQGWLQERYPPPNDVPTLAQSDVDLPPGLFAEHSRVGPHAEHEVRLISVGALVPGKGNADVLRALKILRSNGVRASLTLVGEGVESDELVKYTKELGLESWVQWQGYVEDRDQLIGLLSSADIYVSGSHSEALSRSIIEAMAQGLPVVATDAGAIRELIAGQFVVPVSDSQMIAEAVHGLASNTQLYRDTSFQNLEIARDIALRSDPIFLERFLVSIQE